MSSNRFDPNYQQQKTIGLSNAGNRALVSEEFSDQNVQLVPDSSVEITKFKPHPSGIAHTWLAHPQTIRAVRADIFVVGNGLEDHELEVECQGCSKRIDLQFWKHCPYCETQYSRDYVDPRYNPAFHGR